VQLSNREVAAIAAQQEGLAMDYDLRCEGFPVDEEMRERLLLRGRRIVLGVGPGRPVRMVVKQVEGRVQGRIDVTLPGRRVSAVVWRADPLSAMEAATDAIIGALDEASLLGRCDCGCEAEVSNLQ
jgi:hypothetical protein